MGISIRFTVDLRFNWAIMREWYLVGWTESYKKTVGPGLWMTEQLQSILATVQTTQDYKLQTLSDTIKVEDGGHFVFLFIHKLCLHKNIYNAIYNLIYIYHLFSMEVNSMLWAWQSKKVHFNTATQFS